ncbi:MAG TPA: DNA-binding response regulator [Corynebacterium variabile]|uniref:response regulator transcription factor n=1 Tax=Corynebacterium variabile TaxID=1727 RepID=UPI000EEAF377|nr:response regulator transcription factor [Corynebacterium variabile]HAJ52984.1 DNA-binding response regulator [Corynebacterium variabile]
MDTPTLRIAAIDDHELSLRGLASVVESADDIELVGMFSTVDDLLEGLNDGDDIDLVVLDLRLRDDSDPAVNVERLHALTGNILVLSSLESPFLVRRALRAGVLGMMPKSERAESLLAAIRDASSGRPVTTTEWAAVIDGDPVGYQIGDEHVSWQEVHLSPRQQQVLELYASGEPAKRVASVTGLTAATVQDYLKRIKQKYEAVGRRAQTKTDLVFAAQEDGYLPGPTDPVIG